MTYRERRRARAERLRGWADKRQTDATAVLESQPELRHDWAFITQPGRIPARERMNRADDRAYASLAKADSMARRADGIESAAAHAIYSDDPDAVEQLRAKIERLEAERARIQSYNAACRKAGRSTAEALALLDDAQRADLASVAKCAAFQLGKHGEMPGYVSSNIGGNLSRLRDRLARLQAPAAPRPMVYRPGRGDVCRRCGEWKLSHVGTVPGADLTCPTFEVAR